MRIKEIISRIDAYLYYIFPVLMSWGISQNVENIYLEAGFSGTIVVAHINDVFNTRVLALVLNLGLCIIIFTYKNILYVNPIKMMFGSFLLSLFFANREINLRLSETIPLTSIRYYVVTPILLSAIYLYYVYDKKKSMEQ